MIKWFRKKRPKVDPDELDRQTKEVKDFLEKESPRMNAIANYLIERRGRNGFGEDFDVTFYPRGL